MDQKLSDVVKSNDALKMKLHSMSQQNEIIEKLQSNTSYLSNLSEMIHVTMIFTDQIQQQEINTQQNENDEMQSLIKTKEEQKGLQQMLSFRFQINS